MEVLSEHLCEGWLEGYLLTGRHGLFATYESFAMVVGVDDRAAHKWLEEASELPWRAPVASLNILLTSTCWRNDHNGFSHQGPGLIDVMLSKRGTVARIYLPPDANCLLVGRRPLPAQPQLRQPDRHRQAAAAAVARHRRRRCEHCARGASVWEWASNDGGGEPDVVLACAGDMPTLETIAAAWWLRRHIPELKVRVVNVVDLMTLFPPEAHPHGMSDTDFVELFTGDTDVVFAFHGYQRAIHQLLHGRPNATRFHVRGFNEQGTTTTPFDMVVLNEMSRYHLAAEALRRSRRVLNRAPALIQRCETEIAQAVDYSRRHLEDPPEIATGF